MSKTLSDTFQGKNLPNGGKAFNLSIKKEDVVEEEARLINEYMDPASEADEKPLQLPTFDDECDNDSLENNEEKESFNWDGVQDVQNLTVENHELKDKVVDLQDELDDLHVLLEALEPIPGIDVDSLMDVMHGTEVVDQDIRNIKIVEQAKKNKSLKVSLNRERGRVASLLEKTKKLQDELAAVSSPATRVAATKERKLSSASSPRSSSGDGESASATRKIEELRSKLDKSHAENCRIKKALSKEIGDGVSITKVLTDKSGWKGRSEKILMLQAKLKRMEQTRRVATPAPAETAPIKNLKAQKDLRYERVELLEKSNAEMKETISQYKRKNDATKSRIQVLGKEVEKSKGQVKILLTKANDDDALIELLQKELKDLRHDMQVLKREQSGDTTHAPGIAQLESTIRSQMNQINHQQELIATLKRDNSSHKSGNSTSNTEVEALKAEVNETRIRFQNLIMEKEDEIIVLEDAKEDLEQKCERLLKQGNASNTVDATDSNQVVQKLQAENDFLSSELQKLKKRYGDLLDRIKQ